MKEESRIVEETRQKIATGELTYDQMKEKLIAAINKEYEKEGEPNITLINACEELLAELATDGQPLPESHEKQYGEVIRQNIQVSYHAKRSVVFAKRIAVFLVVIVLLFGGGEIFLHRQWFEHGTTDDEQQHTIQGFEIDPGLVAKAIAAEEDARFLSTSDYQEVTSFLGFSLPETIFLHDWTIDLFVAAIQPFYIKLTIRYVRESTNDIVTAQVCMYSDQSNAYAAFEQNREGRQEYIYGIEGYHSRNIDNNIITWIKNNCLWYCYGNVSDEQLTEIQKQIIGGNNHEKTSNSVISNSCIVSLKYWMRIRSI